MGFDLYFAKCGVPITNSRGLPSKTSYPASPTTAVKNAFGDYDLGKVLGMNFRFFESLWAGALPSDYRIGWRFPGHTNVCSGRDGGSYEAGSTPSLATCTPPALSHLLPAVAVSYLTVVGRLHLSSRPTQDCLLGTRAPWRSAEKCSGHQEWSSKVSACQVQFQKCSHKKCSGHQESVLTKFNFMHFLRCFRHRKSARNPWPGIVAIVRAVH